MQRYVLLLLIALFLLAGTRPATAQIIVTENAKGERILMSETLRRAEHKIMVRAINRVGDARTEWALTFRSTDASSDIQITADSVAIEPLRVATDEEVPGGMTTVFLSGEDFYNIANASTVEVTIGERVLTLPAQIQDDMQRILNRSRN